MPTRLVDSYGLANVVYDFQTPITCRCNLVTLVREDSLLAWPCSITHFTCTCRFFDWFSQTGHAHVCCNLSLVREDTPQACPFPVISHAQLSSNKRFVPRLIFQIQWHFNIGSLSLSNLEWRSVNQSSFALSASLAYHTARQLWQQVVVYQSTSPFAPDPKS